MNNKVSDLIVKTRLYYYLSDIIGKKKEKKVFATINVFN